MFAIFKKIFLACILGLVVFSAGTWQSDQVVLAESQNANIPETPLFPGLTWSNLGSSTRVITTNVNGDTISLLGEGYEAVEQPALSPAQDILNYYSNEQLAKSGWTSYDAFEKSDGVHYIFYHESGVYLSVELLKCPDVSSSICVLIWKSQQTSPTVITPDKASGPSSLAAATGSFGKTSPANNTTNLNPTSIVLSWGAYSPTPDKYSYCVKEGSACDPNDPDWTGTYTNRSVTLTNLSYGKTYYWQVKAITCSSCTPKTLVYADNSTWWIFKTKPATQAVISGNAGIAGATLSYMDGTLKTVTTDNIGAYSITVPLNWSGTVTPAKPGYLFSPKNATFSNLTATQTIQNFNAKIAYTISGNTGIGGVTLSYMDNTSQTVISDGGGNYSIMVPQGWSGTVTPSHPCFAFSPVNHTYSNVTTNQVNQNYTASLIPSSVCVLSVVRANSNPTTASSVDFMVTFSGSVTGVNAADFVLTTTGLTGMSISNVSGSGSTYTVTVNTGFKSGTLRLDVVDDNTIFDTGANPLGGAGAGNGNFTSGETYTVTKTPTFGDVPFSHPYSSSIEILYSNGYTAGCSTTPLNFCPEVGINRAQAAVFMMRGHFGGSYLPPSVPSHIFADSWTKAPWGETWAEAMFNAGLTAGCSSSPLKFCPEDQLTNAQAAVFGLRLKYGALYNPPAASGTVFADLTDLNFWGIAWAEQAYADGLLPACGTSGGKPKFCPDALVNRGFGASIIVKAKNLTMP